MNLLKKSLDSKFLRTHFSLLAVLIVIFAIMSVATPNFGKIDNYLIIARQLSTNVLMALGITLVMICGGIDLSVGSVFTFAAMAIGLLLTNTVLPLWLAIIVVIALGGVFGLLNGTIASLTNIPPFIITLGVGFMAGGGASVLVAGRSVSIIRPAFNNLGSGFVGVIPLTVFYMIFIAIVLGILLSKTKLGRYIYAIGSNATAALYSGIEIKKTKLIVYTICGSLAALAGIINTARTFVAQPDVGAGTELDAIAAVVIGGTSFEGGKGTIFGTILGCLLITVIANSMNHLGITYFWQRVVKGVIILIAVFIDDTVSKREKRRMLSAAGGES